MKELYTKGSKIDKIKSIMTKSLEWNISMQQQVIMF